MTRAAPMRTAIVTASYRGDLDRCRLLCESIDRHVEGLSRHYILVEEADRPLFAPLESERRVIVGERELLPAWLKAVPDPLKRSQRLWVHPYGLPLRGWHVQQLRRLAMAARMEEEVMISCDSDVVVVKPLDLQSFVDGERVRFYRRPGAIDSVDGKFREEHESWSRRAGRLLGITAPATTNTGYITTMIAWRTDTARAMMDRIASVEGRDAIRALAASRQLSECTIYGRFVDEVEGRPERHLSSEEAVCRVYWSGDAMDREGVARFVEELAPGEAAICIQSFTGTDPSFIRSVAKLD